jgi:hypothetical protein
MRASSPCCCRSPVVSSPYSLPSRWPHLPRCRVGPTFPAVALSSFPSPSRCRGGSPSSPSRRPCRRPHPRACRLALPVSVSLSCHLDVVVVVTLLLPVVVLSSSARGGGGGSSLLLLLLPVAAGGGWLILPIPIPILVLLLLPASTPRAVARGGSWGCCCRGCIVGVWSCYRLTTPRAGARGSGGDVGGSGGASRRRQ